MVDGSPGLAMQLDVSGTHGRGQALATFKQTPSGHYVCHDLVVDAVAQSHRQRVVLVHNGQALHAPIKPNA